jgi:hypothetical protein
MPAIRLEEEIIILSTLSSYMHIKMIKKTLENIFISLMDVVMHAQGATTRSVEVPLVILVVKRRLSFKGLK